ncbi:helix-turn-helix domain-containing protein [Nitratireductor aquibiodomus]|uniref:helix-turn-helix domain-containing protein n=1 Tax=Nitratireductor aquibiodomus TaxID=204799 RepID=UPI0019D3ADBD|nr:helix-turn-helix domain-containing protein [Nitratireductor aquibiodomus]
MAYKPVNTSHLPAAFTIPEAADYLRVSVSGVYRLLQKDQLKRTKIGHRTVIRKSDLDAFLNKCVAA